MSETWVTTCTKKVRPAHLFRLHLVVMLVCQSIYELKHFPDIARIAALGGNVYAFSTFWTRILPFATADSPVNQAGIDHYRDQINYCLSNGIEPVV